MAGGLLVLPGRPAEVLYDLSLVPGWSVTIGPCTCGLAVATTACWQGVRAGMRGGGPSLAVGLVVWLMGMGLGAANETVEFLASLALADSRAGRYGNTGWDLTSNLLGSGVVASWLQRRHGTTVTPS